MSYGTLTPSSFVFRSRPMPWMLKIFHRLSFPFVPPDSELLHSYSWYPRTRGEQQGCSNELTDELASTGDPPFY